MNQTTRIIIVSLFAILIAWVVYDVVYKPKKVPTAENPHYVYNSCTKNWAVQTGQERWYGNPIAPVASPSYWEEHQGEAEAMGMIAVPIWDTTDCRLGQEWVFSSKERAEADYKLFLENRHTRAKLQKTTDSLESIKITAKKKTEDSLYKCEQAYK